MGPPPDLIHASKQVIAVGVIVKIHVLNKIIHALMKQGVFPPFRLVSSEYIYEH